MKISDIYCINCYYISSRYPCLKKWCVCLHFLPHSKKSPLPKLVNPIESVDTTKKLSKLAGVGKEEKPSQNSSKAINKIDVRAKLAETAGVSTDTYSKGAKILNSGE